MDSGELIEFYMDNGILVSPELLTELESRPLPLNTPFIVLGKEAIDITNSKKNVVTEDFERAIVLKEKRKDTKLYSKFMEYLGAPISQVPIASKIAVSKTDSNISKMAASPVINSDISDNSLPIHDDPHPDSHSQDDNSNVAQNTSENHATVRSATDDLKFKEDFLKKNRIRVVSSYDAKVRKWAVHDFVSLYNVRFKELEKILRSRQELQSLTSIARISSKKERENVSLIGMVYEKALTKTGNIIMTIEDPTGMVKAVINKSKEDLFRMAEEIQLDEIIGITGMFDNIVFVNNILLPEIPLTKELKKSPEEGYFVVIADTEPGSKLFLEKEFNKFLSWMNGEIGSDKQRELASKIKYLFIAGDLVNGVGIYPNQEFDLNIVDIRDQYTALAQLLKKVPSHIPIFVCPGNHDVGRISEPQPAIDSEYAADLIAMPNVISLSNPSVVNIYAQPENNFDGFDVMFYHGYSFIYYSEHVPSIRKAGSQKRPDMIMKYLLQRRHLAPTHTSTLYIPDPKSDPLTIDKVPDFLLTGHVHRAMVSNYKNVTCINASCWTGQSEEQERRGLEAQPGRAFIVDMRTREVKIMNFLSKDEQDKESQADTAASANVSPAPAAAQSSAADNAKPIAPAGVTHG